MLFQNMFFKLSSTCVFLQFEEDTSASLRAQLVPFLPFPSPDEGSVSEHAAAIFPGGPLLISLQLINFIAPSHRERLQEFSHHALHECVALRKQE